MFLYKRLIREAALRCGSYATFMARPMAQQPGSSMHIHVSVMDAKTGENIFSKKTGKPSAAHTHFIGGQQRHFPALTALAAPYVNSYRRLVSKLSAPANLEWGNDNRSVGIRVPKSGPEARRVENRVSGADANPYLAIAAVLAAGYLGMTERATPRDAATGNAYDNTRDLPGSLLEAVQLLDDSAPLRRLLGTRFVDLFASIKREEHDAYMTVISPWEREHLLLNV